MTFMERWKSWRADRRWRKLVKKYPVLDELLATAWRSGWQGEEWGETLVDKLFEQIPREITLRAPEIMLRVLIAFGDGKIEKALHVENELQCEAVRRSHSPSMN